MSRQPRTGVSCYIRGRRQGNARRLRRVKSQPDPLCLQGTADSARTECASRATISTADLRELLNRRGHGQSYQQVEKMKSPFRCTAPLPQHTLPQNSKQTDIKSWPGVLPGGETAVTLKISISSESTLAEMSTTADWCIHDPRHSLFPPTQRRLSLHGEQARMQRMSAWHVMSRRAAHPSAIRVHGGRPNTRLEHRRVSYFTSGF